MADANAEVRRITLTNHGARARTLEVTSYAEVALNDRRADQAHPAFAKLFLQTEYLPAPPTLLCRRRPRARDQKPIWALHVLAGPEGDPGTAVGEVEYETDRARFLGRGRSAARPAALDSGVALSGTVGSVLDPILSLRRRVRLAPGASAVLAFSTAAVTDRDEAVALAHRFSRPGRSSAHVRAGADPRQGHPGRARHHTRRRSSVSAAGCSRSLHRADPAVARVRHGKPSSASRACGRTPSPETCQSCWPDSPAPARLIWPANFSAPTPIGAAAGWWRTWSSSTTRTSVDELQHCAGGTGPVGTDGRAGEQARRRVPANRGGDACGGRDAARSSGTRDPARARRLAGRAARAGAHPRDAAGPTCASQAPRRRLPASRLLPTKGCCSPTGWVGSRRTAGSTS